MTRTQTRRGTSRRRSTTSRPAASRSRSRRGDYSKTTKIATIIGAMGAMGAIAYMIFKPSKAFAPGLTDETLPANPPRDRWGNAGEDNMVDPLDFRDDEYMQDKMNPHNGLI